ncbi:MAG: alpha/beta hydrolase [Hyphomicrobium zavarzinii]|jgi:acetyl esterase|uniref:alpha/beta hydrolase n=1 Tax=Hyphomicrobium TaxID=81 RepID=UPI0003A23253|nr:MULTISPECIES: alpha/beta hydrolase [Hyphomicrobium]MBL8846214.1 alpha/beta hydrolase [Hyphomicrobium zavarzinii]WBT38446.1 alpha/beta hydrolase [Hyphomicrobium sp. DMF-1]HML41777.1 alpha/beta hydrolase [Hyphomicrobium zavarzinii]
MSELHPTLKNILSQPENPNAVPVEVQDPNEARKEWKGDMAGVDAPAPHMGRVWEFEIPGPAGSIPARAYQPEGLVGEKRPLLIYYHGGGFIRGDIDTHDSICRVLASKAGCLVVSPAYRLAPENPFPAAAHDAYAVAEYMSANAAAFGVDPDRIAVGGDSAGGNVAIAACLQARDKGGPKIRYQLLIYPVTDLTSQNESKRLYSKGYLLNSMPFYIASYLGPNGDGGNELASPLLAKDLSRLPQALVITAGFDPLRDEGQDFARKLAASGVEVKHKCYEDMIHGFVSLRGLLPEADAALGECARHMAEALGGKSA